MKRWSFSLIELMVALSIVLIICSFFFSQIVDVGDQFLIAEQEKLFMTFSYLQQKAMASGKRQHLFFDCNKNHYRYTRVKKKHVTKLHPPIEFGFLSNVYGPPSDPKKKIHVPITFSTQQKRFCATFFPDGRVSPGTVYLLDTKKRLLGALTSPIAPMSYVRKYRYSNGRWEQK